MGKSMPPCKPSGEAAGEASGRSRAVIPVSMLTPISKMTPQPPAKACVGCICWGPICFQNPPLPWGESSQQVILPGSRELAISFPARVCRAILWDEGGCSQGHSNTVKKCHFPLFLPNLCPFLSVLSQPSFKTSRLQRFPRRPGTQL